MSDLEPSDARHAPPPRQRRGVVFALIVVAVVALGATSIALARALEPELSGAFDGY